MDWLSRTELLIGNDSVKKIRDSRVAVFGLGGVGGYVVEALVRCGIGAIDLIDCDKVGFTNLNRQIIATVDTVGREKTEVSKERVHSINPECKVTIHNVLYLPESGDSIDFQDFDYVVDAIDSVAGKMEIVERAKKFGIPIISSMGTGNKLDPTKLEVADIYETSVCPLSKVIRKECRKRGIDSLKVVYSREEPMKCIVTNEPGANTKRHAPGSISFVPSVAGLIIASEVVKDLIKENRYY